ncbi:HNH endonuclease [Kitasatospora sp. NPDC127116]|uniref:HNH endonuclease n=1 Tax=Kitasatospora sp. NPDC127116 TaxID=3345367 RepID=UPI0036449585
MHAHAGEKAAINVALTNGYTKRMAKKGSAGHAFYLKLQKSGPDGQCALCGCRFADTLDHQLPKGLYPLLAVAPSNLAPACASCNGTKQDLNPVDAQQQTLNPYFDHEADQHTWLTARIIPPSEDSGTPIGITYHAEPPPGMPGVLAARAKFHFERLALAEVYASNAGPQVRTESRRIRDRGLADPEDIRGHLAEEVNIWKAEQRNGWQVALYTALVNDDWYVNGGYLVVAG